MRYIQDPLAKRLLRGEFAPHDTIVVDVDLQGQGGGGAGGGAREGEGELTFKKKIASPVAAVS
jgi:hypothetical protein